MVKPLTFIARALFLAFFALNAWNTLKDLNRFHLSFHKNYVKFEKAFTKKTGVKFPALMASSFIEKHSEKLIRLTAWLQLALCGAALFIMPGLTSLVGLIYFILSIVHFNVADFSLNMKLADLEPFSLSIALLAASVFLSLPSIAHCGSQLQGKFQRANETASASANNQRNRNKM